MDFSKVTTLEEFLSWVVSGGGALALAYVLMERVQYLKDLTAEYKRYASILLACGLGTVGFLLLVVVGYRDAPPDARTWIEALFSVWLLAYTGSQALHGRRQLRSR
jgi:hypothetical protein